LARRIAGAADKLLQYIDKISGLAHGAIIGLDGESGNISKLIFMIKRLAGI
jgi:hypothetical protein